MAVASRPAQLNVDGLIERLLAQRLASPCRYVKISESEIKQLCRRASEILLSQPMLLELDVPIKICGDIHGQFADLLRLFEYAGFPPQHNFLFLGDYVDRGNQQIETISLLLAFKVRFPENFFLLRGNHEDTSMNMTMGFHEECMTRYGHEVFRSFSKCFECLPIAAILANSIFCAHGGISPKLRDLNQIRCIQRPLAVPMEGMQNQVMRDLLWSDPDRNTRVWAFNTDRNISGFFGKELLKQFLERFDLQLVVRAHQVVQDGYEFFGDRKLVTIFSAPNYTGAYDNSAAVMVVDENLHCSFQILSPSKKNTTGQIAQDWKR